MYSRILPKTRAKVKAVKKGEGAIAEDFANKFPDRWADFARTCKIRGGKGIQVFDPYEYQIKLIDLIEKTPTTVITKTRQLGFTESIANYFLWKACKNPGYLGVVFSKSQTDTSNIAKRVRRHLESIDLKTRTNALTDIELVNGGRILFRNSTPNGARGLEAVHDILFDEVGFVKEIEEIHKAALPCTTVLGDRARVILLSTPAGQAGFYWDKLALNNGDRDLLKICDRIKNREVDPIQIWHDDEGVGKFITHWLAHPEFSQKNDYLANTKKRLQLSEDTLQQEYNLSFVSGEQIVFDPKLVRSCALAQWEEPKPDGIYRLALDSSLLGADYTVCAVLKEIEPDKHSLVAMYRARGKTHQVHIYEIGELINQYNPVKAAIEVNSAGQIYYEQLSEEFLNIDFVPIKTTAYSKAPMVNRLILALETESLIYPNDPAIVKELLSFRSEDGKLQAVSGAHDDIVMALCFGCAIAPMNFS